MSTSAPFPCWSTTDVCSRPVDGTTASASAYGPSSRAQTTACAGGTGKPLAHEGAPTGCAGEVAGSDGVAALTGPGVSCASRTTTSTATAPRSRAPIAAPRRTQIAVCSRIDGRLRGARRTPARLEERREPDRHEIERDERRRLEHRRHRIDAGKRDADHRHREHSHAPTLPHARGGEDPQA